MVEEYTISIITMDLTNFFMPQTDIYFCTNILSILAFSLNIMLLSVVTDTTLKILARGPMITQQNTYESVSIKFTNILRALPTSYKCILLQY